MAYSTLLIGPTNNLVQNEVYALPARLVFIKSSAALEVGDTSGSFSALAGANTTGVNCAGGFVRCTTGAAVVRCKVM
jgi:hypothetical protein